MAKHLSIFLHNARQKKNGNKFNENNFNNETTVCSGEWEIPKRKKLKF